MKSDSLGKAGFGNISQSVFQWSFLRQSASLSSIFASFGDLPGKVLHRSLGRRSCGSRLVRH